MLSSFPPIINEQSEILILGTMPGATSLLKQEYYGYPRNHFWTILHTVFERLPVPEDFSERIVVLRDHHIALWDVLQHCERKGSLDIHIKNHIENDFDGLFGEFPNIRRILFNGKESHRYFTKKFGQLDGIEYHVMPSTSPANTMRFVDKLAIWSEALLPTNTFPERPAGGGSDAR